MLRAGEGFESSLFHVVIHVFLSTHYHASHLICFCFVSGVISNGLGVVFFSS